MPAQRLTQVTDMLHFLETVRDSMLSARRTSPTAQDFSLALSGTNIAPSELLSHLSLNLPQAITTPTIPPPPPSETPPPNFAPMLGSTLAGVIQTTHPYIPAHFPPLPSRHAWQSTAVFTEREKDPRKIRERATQEGILAEQALRKLTSANKPKALQDRMATQAEKKKEQLWQDTLADVLQDEGEQGEGEGLVEEASGGGIGDGKVKAAELLKAGGGMMVNHDRGHWRRGAPLRAVRS